MQAAYGLRNEHTLTTLARDTPICFAGTRYARRCDRTLHGSIAGAREVTEMKRTRRERERIREDEQRIWL